MRSFDTAVIGLGVMGSAVAYYLSKHADSLVGFERSSINKIVGSSKGSSKVFRRAYFEGDLYADFLMASEQLWRELSSQAEQELLVKTGILHIGSPNSAMLQGATKTANARGVAIEDVSSDIKNRFPMFQIPPGWKAFYEASGGYLNAECAVKAFRTLGVKQGAQLYFDTEVKSISPSLTGVEINTSSGLFHVRQCIISAGPWLSTVMPELHSTLSANNGMTITRQPVSWFKAESKCDQHPVFVIELPTKALAYGFPDFEGKGIKATYHSHGRPLRDGDDFVEPWAVEEAIKLHSELKPFLPDTLGAPQFGEVCLYTNLNENRFLIDWHKTFPNVLIVSPCSGHGFKMAPAVGLTIADMVRGKETTAVNRFGW